MAAHADNNDAADRPSRFPWPPVLLVGVIAAAWVLGRVLPLDWTGVDDWPARAVGYAIGIAGIGLAVWAILTLVRAGTTVRPDARATRLVVSGPFRRFRNPIYLADVMILLGIAELTHNIWFVVAAAAFGVLVTWLAILPEERHLEAVFGDEYRAYKAGSRRWL
jgi:protein-S-isoprenylcysteine O-methyltransferase Ste14